MVYVSCNASSADRKMFCRIAVLLSHLLTCLILLLAVLQTLQTVFFALCEGFPRIFFLCLSMCKYSSGRPGT